MSATTRQLEVSDILQGAMTVRELAEQLKALADGGMGDLKVVFTCDYGDHCHTQQALLVENVEQLDYDQFIDTCPGYSRSGLALKTDRDDGHGETTYQETLEEIADTKVEVIVLS